MAFADISAFKRSATNVRGRGSVYIPKQDKRKKIDFSGANLDQASDRDDDERKLNRNSSSLSETEGKFNLKQYNMDRKARLYQFDYSME